MTVMKLMIFSNISLSYTVITQNVSVQKENSSRIFQQNAFSLENEIQSQKFCMEINLF